MWLFSCMGDMSLFPGLTGMHSANTHPRNPFRSPSPLLPVHCCLQPPWHDPVFMTLKEGQLVWDGSAVLCRLSTHLLLGYGSAADVPTHHIVLRDISCMEHQKDVHGPLICLHLPQRHVLLRDCHGNPHSIAEWFVPPLCSGHLLAVPLFRLRAEVSMPGFCGGYLAVGDG